MNCLFNYGFKEAFLATSQCVAWSAQAPRRRLGQVFAFMIRHDAGKREQTTGQTDSALCVKPPHPSSV